MEFEFTCDAYSTFEQTFKLKPNLNLKLKSLKPGAISSISFTNELDEEIPIPDDMDMDGATRFGNNFLISVQSYKHSYKLLWNRQVVFVVSYEHITTGYAYIPPRYPNE